MTENGDMKRVLWTLAVIAVAALSCTKQEIESGINPAQGGQKDVTYLKINSVTTSELVKSAIKDTSFPTDMEVSIGLFVVGDGYTDAKYCNIKCTKPARSDKFTDPQIELIEGKTATVYAYYPYSEDIKTFADLKAIPISSSVNGTDWMWATPITEVSTTKPSADLKFNHTLALVEITFNIDDPLDKLFGDVTVAGSKDGASFSKAGKLDATNGTITPDAEQTATKDNPLYSQDVEFYLSDGKVVADCLLVPCKTGDDADTRQDFFIKCTYDHKTYSVSLTGEKGIIVRQNTKSTSALNITPYYEPADFRIVYQFNDLDDSCTFALAKDIQREYAYKTGKKFEIIDGSKEEASGKEIIIGRTNRSQSEEYYSTKKDGKDAFNYLIEEKDSTVAIMGVGSWALKYACEEFAEDFAEHGYVEGKKIEGTVRGKELFRYSSGCNLRIFNFNAWERQNYTKNPPYWVEQGEDCRYEARVKNFTQIIRAYKYPDVICFQEYTNEFNKCLTDSLDNSLENFSYSFAQRETDDYTSIIFNSKKLTFLKKYHHVFGKYSDEIDPGKRKSYTINVFRHKTTNKQFMMVTTQLWDGVNTDEDFLCKLDEIKQVYAGIEEVLKEYNVPVFLVGDMNCKRASEAMQYLETRGYLHLCDAMPDPDGSMGWHPCDDDGYKREYDPGQETWWMGNTYDRKEKGKNSIDHFYMYNYGSTQAKAYEHIHAYFTVLLSDHYPTYADFIFL